MKTKTRRRTKGYRASKGKVQPGGPQPARKKRLARKQRRDRLELGQAPRLDTIRGDGPPVRKIESLKLNTLGGVLKTRPCTRCDGRNADMVVTWEHWHRGAWRKAIRYLCTKHGSKAKARLQGARVPA
jgi:hypothetical protein